MSFPFISEVCFSCQNGGGMFGDFVEVVFPVNYAGEALTVAVELPTSNRTLTSTLRPATPSTCVVVLARTVPQARQNLFACSQCDFAGMDSRKIFLFSAQGSVLDVLATNANQSTGTEITVFRNARLSPAAFGTVATPFLDSSSREFPCGLTSSTTTTTTTLSTTRASTTSTTRSSSTTSSSSSTSSFSTTSPSVISGSTTTPLATTTTTIAPLLTSSLGGSTGFFTPTNASPVQSPFPLIPVAAGAAGGGFVLIVLIVLLVCCLMRRKKNEDLIYSERGGVGSSSIAMVEQQPSASALTTDGVYKVEKESDGDDGLYHCIHSTLKRKAPVYAQQDYERSEHVQFDTNDDYVLNANNRGGRRRDAAATPQTIRVLFDTRYVNDEITCRDAGQVTLDQLAYESLGSSAPRITCGEADVLTVDKAAVLLTVLNDASSYLSNTFALVRPIVGSLKLTLNDPNDTFVTPGPTLLCNRVGLAVPPEYAEVGVPDVDLIVFVTTWPVLGTFRGYAEPCQFDADTGRPIVGFINLNPAKLDSLTQNFPTVVHELFHVLGFKENVFPRFVNDLTLPALNKSDPERPVLQSPKVLERARIHFNCSTLTGAPMEAAADHWKKTVFGDDLMTAAVGQRFPPLSYTTLAAFEDSGWYTVDYRRASSLVFGRSMGCAFVEQKCETRIIDGYSPCGASKRACAFDQRSYGACPEFSALLGECLIPSNTVSCVDGLGGADAELDTPGPDSRCFGINDEAHCLLARCEGTNEVRVTWKGQSYSCLGDVPRIVKLVDGSELRCPSASDFCGCQCDSGGVCLRGRCVCQAGRDGSRCELSLPAFNAVQSPTKPVPKLTPRFPIIATAAPTTAPPASGAAPEEVPLLPIIAGAGGGIVVLICLGLIVMIYVRRSMQQRRARGAAVGRRQRADASANPIAMVPFGTMPSNEPFNNQQQPTRSRQMRRPVKRSRENGPPTIDRASKRGLSPRTPQAAGKVVPVLFDAVGVWDCYPDDTDELAFCAGDTLEVLDDSDENWWVCRLNGRIGNVPATFLEIPMPDGTMHSAQAF